MLYGFSEPTLTVFVKEAPIFYCIVTIESIILQFLNKIFLFVNKIPFLGNVNTHFTLLSTVAQKTFSYIFFVDSSWKIF